MRFAPVMAGICLRPSSLEEIALRSDERLSTARALRVISKDDLRELHEIQPLRVAVDVLLVWGEILLSLFCIRNCAIQWCSRPLFSS